MRIQFLLYSNESTFYLNYLNSLGAKEYPKVLFDGDFKLLLPNIEFCNERKMESKKTLRL